MGVSMSHVFNFVHHDDVHCFTFVVEFAKIWSKNSLSAENNFYLLTLDKPIFDNNIIRNFNKLTSPDTALCRVHIKCTWAKLEWDLWIYHHRNMECISELLINTDRFDTPSFFVKKYFHSSLFGNQLSQDIRIILEKYYQGKNFTRWLHAFFFLRIYRGRWLIARHWGTFPTTPLDVFILRQITMQMFFALCITHNIDVRFISCSRNARETLRKLLK